MNRYFTVLLLSLALPLGALGADPAGIDKPVPQVGTSWRMRVTDGMTKALVSDTQYRLSAIHDTDIEISDDSGQVGIVLDAADFALKRTGERSFDPPLQRLRYPLVPGSRWEVAYAYFNPQCGPTQSKLAFKVAEWDDVNTPTGKLRALRVDSQGTWRNGCGADRQTHKHWYIPEFGVPVRQESTVYVQGRIFSHEVHELMSYSRP